jgi:hypothetical protein
MAQLIIINKKTIRQFKLKIKIKIKIKFKIKIIQIKQ